MENAISISHISEIVAAEHPGMQIIQEGNRFLFKSTARISLNTTPFSGAFNKIIYGAPGTGKSYKIHKELSLGAQKVVTVFHPDTQHNDFVGALKPKMVKNEAGQNVITYQFRPGPFTQALILAKSRPDKHICLIIEEINRASAAAVFGELFQLLDRNITGESTYRIDATDPDMLNYINDELSSIGESPLDKLEIPANLSLLATMNSSDQAVMPLDTAFKRRWSFEYLQIDFNQIDIPQVSIPLKTPNGKYAVKWTEFAQLINETLIDCGIAEDRLIGPFFLNGSELEDEKTAKSALNGKLFIYLWDDVLRHFGHQKLFSPAFKTFGQLSAAFSRDEAVFCNAVSDKIEAVGDKFEDEGTS
jgi:hypothetical protein